MNAPIHFRPLPALPEARRHSTPNARLESLRKASQYARDAILTEGTVEALASCKLVTFPYPSQFGFSGGALSPAPYVMMTNRMNVVQYRDPEGVLRTLVFNPTDYKRGEKAPFYADLIKKYGEFLSQKVMKTIHGTVQSHLAQLTVRPEDVDYIAFDHLHIQDLRGWLGGDGPAYFPNAKLLVQRAEWEGARDLHPMQRVWYVPDGTRGVPDERVVLLDGDAWLGKGVAIVSTPGHTNGNMSLAVGTDRGLFVISENGVATESYSPEKSTIPGIRGAAGHLGLEVVLNGNTRENSLEQYTSMVVEKVLAGPSKADADYVNFYPSSELTPSILAPGLTPSFSHGDVNFGTVRRPDAVVSRAA